MLHLYSAGLCVYNNGKLNFQYEWGASIVLLYDLPLFYTEIHNAMWDEVEKFSELLADFQTFQHNFVQREQKCE